ncbi:MAG: translation initiation factor IF-3 [Magnetococcales bacterium]|nr:translation initiation factor IF-3 [Magnetococcales bacterium]
MSKLPIKERPVSQKQGDDVRVNEQIRYPRIRLISEDSVQVGVVSRDQAMAMAAEAGMDLVEVAPEADPPVCKIMDYTKFKYQKTLRERQARRNQARIDTKEVKFRPGTDEHDYGVKLRSIRKFLEAGDKVKCTLRFRGREMAHQEFGQAILDRVEADLTEIAKVEQPPKLLGRQITMVLAPTPQAIKAGAARKNLPPQDPSLSKMEDRLHVEDDDDDDDDDDNEE